MATTDTPISSLIADTSDSREQEHGWQARRPFANRVRTRLIELFPRPALIHARPIPHDESQPHAHALTSLVLFNHSTVSKIYTPGLMPRALYWLAFQAPFPYEANLKALNAAVLRRNLAGLLSEYWYGECRVARALRVDCIDGRYALTSELVDGGAPRDLHAARQFLLDLSDHFDEAGLPTWQVDPRQPRSFGNLLQRTDGAYVIIDLESGLVSPLASPRAWYRALRRARVPIFDDVYFDLTRAYVARESATMRRIFGEGWVNDLDETLDRAEDAARIWHASEPRIWSRLLRGIWGAVGLRPVGERRRDRHNPPPNAAARLAQRSPRMIVQSAEDPAPGSPARNEREVRDVNPINHADTRQTSDLAGVATS